MNKLYIIGSLRNPEIPKVAASLRFALPGLTIFDDWYSAGPEADDHWRDYEMARGHSYFQALGGFAAKNVFNFDKTHLDSSDGALLVLPAGKSGHLELGYMAGKGKWTGILQPGPDPERWDVMYQFADGVFWSVESVIAALAEKIVRKERGNG